MLRPQFTLAQNLVIDANTCIKIFQDKIQPKKLLMIKPHYYNIIDLLISDGIFCLLCYFSISRNMEYYIDSHVHCGRLSGPSFQDYLTQIEQTHIKTAVVFSSVAEIYDRNDPNFKDNTDWQLRRTKANEHILSLNTSEEFKVYSFFFVWNDFSIEQLKPFVGIKWHRHHDEPKYDYKSPRCREFIAEIQRRNLPVVLEEEFENTLLFISELAPQAIVIIPHCGLLNGGYDELCKSGIWKKANVHADTALAGPEIIADFIGRYGHEKILFGSDFPFGDPVFELTNILDLRLSGEVKESILCSNIVRLTSQVERRDCL